MEYPNNQESDQTLRDIVIDLRATVRSDISDLKEFKLERQRRDDVLDKKISSLGDKIDNMKVGLAKMYGAIMLAGWIMTWVLKHFNVL